jgi:hypothetical protein
VGGGLHQPPVKCQALNTRHFASNKPNIPSPTETNHPAHESNPTQQQLPESTDVSNTDIHVKNSMTSLTGNDFIIVQKYFMQLKLLICELDGKIGDQIDKNKYIQKLKFLNISTNTAEAIV